MTLNFEQWCKKSNNIEKLARSLKSSTPQEYVSFYLNQKFSDIEFQKQFDWLGNYSLDIYIPSLQLAIEYDGIYYHSNRQDSDQIKTSLCRSHRITVLRIKEQDSSVHKKPKGKNCIFYYFDKKYRNIDIAINELCSIINKMFLLSIQIDVNIERDREKILSYIQEKHYKKSIAYVWPESKDYWDNVANHCSIFDVFYTSNNCYILKCPHCYEKFKFRIRYFHNRKSLIPCNCELANIEQDLKEAINNYKKFGTLISFDNSLHSRRLYDRMASEVRFFIAHRSAEEKEMYKRLGFRHPLLKSKQWEL